MSGKIDKNDAESQLRKRQKTTPNDDAAEKHPIAGFLAEVGILRKIVRYAGVEGVGKIKSVSKTSWERFGGDSNGQALVADRYPHLVKPLGLRHKSGEDSMHFLKARCMAESSTGSDSDRRPPTLETLDKYIFEVEMTIEGRQSLTFVFESASLDTGGIRLRLDDKDSLALRNTLTSIENDNESNELVLVATSTIIEKDTLKMACINRIK